MHHFKYNGENIFDDSIEHGDWVLMSLGSNYYFNRAEFQQWCEEEHSEFLENYADYDEDGKFIHWDEVDMDMELAWLVEAVVTGKVTHYKHTYE
jgi:hypothetical protein